MLAGYILLVLPACAWALGSPAWGGRLLARWGGPSLPTDGTLALSTSIIVALVLLSTLPCAGGWRRSSAKLTSPRPDVLVFIIIYFFAGLITIAVVSGCEDVWVAGREIGSRWGLCSSPPYYPGGVIYGSSPGYTVILELVGVITAGVPLAMILLFINRRQKSCFHWMMRAILLLAASAAVIAAASAAAFFSFYWPWLAPSDVHNLHGSHEALVYAALSFLWSAGVFSALLFRYPACMRELRLCLRCGYDVRGSTGACPECGWAKVGR